MLLNNIIQEYNLRQFHGDIILSAIYNICKCHYITIVMTTEGRTCRPEYQRQQRDEYRAEVLVAAWE